MRLVKHAHACVSLVKDSSTLLVDPGTFTPDAAELIDAADAVLVTHEHFDHVDREVMADALARRPELEVFAPAAVADVLPDAAGRVHVVRPGQKLAVADFTVVTAGGRHALIHEDIPVVENVGYLIDDVVYHPGDAYDAPPQVETLLLPTSGPWTKLGEAADFVRRVAPARVVAIHDVMLSSVGVRSTAMLLGEEGLTGLPLHQPEPGASMEL